MSAFRPVEAYATSMLVMLGSRLEEHQEKFSGKKPRCFVLHRPSIDALDAECMDRFGILERGEFPTGPFGTARTHRAFMGVLIGLCADTSPTCEDMMIDCNNEPQPL
jgi:hypothetical protein